MQDYKKRMILPLIGIDDINFYTLLSKLFVCKGYVRVVIGQRGPYVEFEDKNIFMKNIHIPYDHKWRCFDDPKWKDKIYYIEYRSNDEANVKIYKQMRTVDYADYKIGNWYISPFDLISDKFPILVTPLKIDKYTSLDEWI